MWLSKRQYLTDQAALTQAISELQRGQKQIMLDLKALTTAVENETAVDASVEKLLTTMAAQIQTLINQSGNTVDPAALQALVDTMKANAATLSAAVTANTPAALPVVPPVAPVPPVTPAPVTPAA